MHIVMLSGGSGKRLWPLSNEVRSKQFLPVLSDVGGQPESMVQRVYRQIQGVGGWDSVTVVAGASQYDQLKLQLGESVHVIIEPERRDTFPAIALVSAHLHDQLKVAPNEPVAVIPVDPYVDESFFKTLQSAATLFGSESNDLLVLMGAIPTTPSEKYGYILPKTCQVIAEVAQFKEKPCREQAVLMIAQGALWNCGVFIIQLSYLLNILTNKYQITNHSFEYVYHHFSNLKKTSFDYEVVENAKRIQVIRYEGSWKDLGTWETLTEEMGCHAVGIVQIDSNCINTHVLNEQDVPVIVMGISDAVVVSSPDGILVAEKGETYRLKEFLKDVDQRPMYEDRLWGSYRVLSQSVTGGTEVLIKQIYLRMGQVLQPRHTYDQKTIMVVAGICTITCEGDVKKLYCGQTYSLVDNALYSITAEEAAQLVEVRIAPARTL